MEIIMMNGHEGSSIAADKYKRDYYKDSYHMNLSNS